MLGDYVEKNKKNSSLIKNSTRKTYFWNLQLWGWEGGFTLLYAN